MGSGPSFGKSAYVAASAQNVVTIQIDWRYPKNSWSSS